MSFFKKTQARLSRRNIGSAAEAAACQFLRQRGVKLLQKNYHSRFGEIDLIMQEGDTILFVEVRCRKKQAQVNAAESISFAKIKKIRQTAKYYLLQFKLLPDCRFDVIAMTHDVGKSGYTIEWIKNAF